MATHNETTIVGLPDGVMNMVNGDKETVDTLLTDSRVNAVGFGGWKRSLFGDFVAYGPDAVLFQAQNHYPAMAVSRHQTRHTVFHAGYGIVAIGSLGAAQARNGVIAMP